MGGGLSLGAQAGIHHGSVHFPAFAGTRYPSSHPHPGPGRTFGVPAIITGSLKTVSAPAEQTGAS